MGDFEVALPKQNGELSEHGTLSSWPLEPSNPPRLKDIPLENWRLSDQITTEIIRKIQPTAASEERRRNVVDRVQQLIKKFLHCEVFPFGSVPLKTYLPDGDIDLTALRVQISEDSLAAEVRSVLEREEQNKDSKFEVKDVQYIHAEVKLVKCLVQNIVVDISFNQIGGLGTLCFLEEVDGIIGKDNLFRRTIILIKAWCYYESRILGAHHSLISTYALETLVLYIFQFHSSLDGPLMVLYRFLDYFSKFDWDNFCICLRGPVRVSSLPEIVAEMPETDGGGLLLSTELLNTLGEKYSVPTRNSEGSHRLFVKKYLNIVDPLKENNNLGRSVSKGNLYRIRSAFAYGARNLERILLSHGEDMSTELNNFFKNTLDRHGKGERPDVQDLTISSSSDVDFHGGHENSSGTILCPKENDEGIESGVPLSSPLDESHLQGHITSKTAPKHPSRTSICSLANNVNRHLSGPVQEGIFLHKATHAPHQFFHKENGDTVKEDADQYVNYRDSHGTQPFSESQQTSDSIRLNRVQAISPRNVESSSVSPSMGNDGTPDSGSAETNLANLAGNCSLHNENFIYAQKCIDSFFNTSISPGLPSPHYAAIHGTMIPHINGYIHQGSPYTHPPGFYPRKAGFMPHFPLDAKHRGTGTYIPNVNNCTSKDRSAFGRGRNQLSANQVQRSWTNGRATAPPESNSSDVRGSPVSSGNGRGKPGHLEIFQPSSISPRGLPHSNGNNNHPLENQLQFGSLESGPLRSPTPESGRTLDSNSSHSHASGSAVVSSSAVQNPGTSSNDGRYSSAVQNPGTSSNDGRYSSAVQNPGTSSNDGRSPQGYRLKDEEFPPLSVRGNPNAVMHPDEHKPAWEAKR